MLDFTGAALSLLCTYYFTKAQRFAWILGIAATIVNAFLYFQKGIYGALGLESIYCISMLYGWFQWTHPQQSSSLVIRDLRPTETMVLTFIAGMGIIGLYTALTYWSDSTIPFWDACTTILALIAQWLLCRKVLQCWILWFVVDVMIAVLQFHKAIPYHSAIHCVYLVMAVMGYYRWKKLCVEAMPEKQALVQQML